MRLLFLVLQDTKLMAEMLLGRHVARVCCIVQPDAHVMIYIIMVCMALDTNMELIVVLVVLDSAKKSGVADEFRIQEIVNILVSRKEYDKVFNHLDMLNAPLEGKNNPEGKEYSFDLIKPLSLIMERRRQVVPIDFFFNNDLEYLKGGSSSKKYTTLTTKTKASKYGIPGGWQELIIGVESYQRSLNITKPQTSPKLHTLHTAILKELSIKMFFLTIAFKPEMDYLPKRKWSNLDRQRSHIMIKAIDKLLLEIRLTRSLEKFVGGRDYGEDFRLLERII
ncbi:hypothetical protein Tco_1367412 [Tanacetum coccineum]